MKPQPEPPGQALLDLFSRTSDAVIAIDSLWRIVAWNPAATALFGHTPAQVLGKCCADVLRWRDRHGNLVCGPECAIRKQAARELPGETQEVVATTRSGRAVWVSVSSLVLPRHYHRVCRVVHFAPRSHHHSPAGSRRPVRPRRPGPPAVAANTHRAGARGSRSADSRRGNRRDRGAAVHLPGHRKEPHRPHPGQAARAQPPGSGRLGAARPLSRPPDLMPPDHQHDRRGR